VVTSTLTIDKMANLNLSVPHKLSQDEALWRIKTLLKEVKVGFSDKISDLCEKWDGNTGIFSFEVMGSSISGTLTVKGDKVEVSGSIPFAMTFFRRKIETTIQEKAKSILA